MNRANARPFRFPAAAGLVAFGVLLACSSAAAQMLSQAQLAGKTVLFIAGLPTKSIDQTIHCFGSILRAWD